MKRVGFLIEAIADMDNLLLAFYKAQRGKQAKKEVVLYRECLQDNLLGMQKQILSGEVNVGSYHTFTIYDPKKRLICASCFEERVLHHALMNVCHPYFERQLIFHTYATRIGKGTYSALEQAHKYTIRYKYVAKLDVRKYFDSINHYILKRQLTKLFKDNVLLKIFSAIIDTYATEKDCGLPIGNLTSQYFANHYLSCLDHYIKEQLHISGYVRYMDDMLLFSDEKTVLYSKVEEIEKYFNENLELKIKPPIIVSTKRGISFLGYSLQSYRIGLNSRSRNRFSRKMNIYGKLLAKGEWSDREYYEHITPLISFTGHAYTKKLRRNIINKVENRWALTV
ncbi:MAG: RNA-directed DNA polymerase [Bacteroidales bacterium]|nr:RNA-directed DNA polymerase [Bacteroidales bacterium]